MEYTPRTFKEITEAMVSYLAAHPDLADGVLPSDLAVGSLERAHLEAVGVVMEEYDQRTADAVMAAIPESCYRAFGFARLSPRMSTGSVICTSYAPVPYDVAIPQGSVFQGPNGLLFVSTADGLIASGTTTSGSIPVQAKIAGFSGNVAENTITRIVSPIPFIDLVTNPQATASGADEESDDARALRFQAFLRTIPRGTKEALEFAALSVASGRVIAARAVEPFLLSPVPPGVPFAGRVWLFVDDGTTSETLDPSLVTEVSNYVNGYIDGGGNQIPGYKASGIIVDILKATPKMVRVRGTVKLAPGAISRWTEIQANMTAAVVAYFESLRIAEAASYQNLVTAVTISDPDIRDAALVYWFDGDTVPEYGAPIMATNLNAYDALSPLTIGARLRAVQGAADGVTYPEWVLG